MITGAQDTRGSVIARARELLVLLAMAAIAVGCAEQRIRDTARTQFRAGEYENAVHGLEAGLKDHPDSPLLRAGLIETRTEALARILGEAAAARAAGQLEEADKALKRANALQPGNPRVEALMTEIAVERRQRTALAEAEGLVSQRKTGNVSVR